jgi:hypothetical protein
MLKSCQISDQFVEEEKGEWELQDIGYQKRIVNELDIMLECC